MRRLLPALAATVAALALAAPTASAANGPVETLRLTGSQAVVGIADTGEKGPTPGDIRTLSLGLVDAGGRPMGRVEVTQILTLQTPTGGTAIKSFVMTLPKGTITGTGTAGFTDITDPASRPNDATERLVVTGGSGRYLGASGTVDITVLPGFTSRWVVRLATR